MSGKLTINFPLLTIIINNITRYMYCNFLHRKHFLQRFNLICFQGDCMNLNVAIDSEVINIDGAVTKFLGKDAFKYKVKMWKLFLLLWFLIKLRDSWFPNFYFL